jgi:thiosulfate dehydrogenase
MRTLAITLALAGATTSFLGGCRQSAPRDGSSVAQTGAPTRAVAWDPAVWRPPTLAEVPADSLGNAIRYGRALVMATADSLPQFVGSNLSCTSCHLEEGRRATAAPLTGAFARYPRYIERTGAVVSMQERVNYCMTRSLAGSRLPNDSREMQAILAYLAYMSRGVPIGARLSVEGMPRMPAAIGDTVRGAEVYRTTCARCHGADGTGMTAVPTLPGVKVPALWGARSFSIGASMARQERAASFIRYNMPFDRPGSLTDRQAYDVAAYITSRPRPDMPEKAGDWPLGGAPADVPYETKGHKAYHQPPLLPRSNPAEAFVPTPGRARDQREQSIH